MKENKTVFIVFLSFPLAFILAVLLCERVTFTMDVTPSERKIMYFKTNTTMEFSEKTPIITTSLRNPITPHAQSHKEFPRASLSDVAPPQTPQVNRVSFILINQVKKMAIVDGKFVTEGDLVRDYRVVKIEKDKVLLKNKEGEKWLTLD